MHLIQPALNFHSYRSL